MELRIFKDYIEIDRASSTSRVNGSESSDVKRIFFKEIESINFLQWRVHHGVNGGYLHCKVLGEDSPNIMHIEKNENTITFEDDQNWEKIHNSLRERASESRIQIKILDILYNKKKNNQKLDVELLWNAGVTVKELKGKLRIDNKIYVSDEKIQRALRGLERRQFIHVRRELPEIVDGMRMLGSIESARISDTGIEALLRDTPKDDKGFVN